MMMMMILYGVIINMQEIISYILCHMCDGVDSSLFKTNAILEYL